MSTRRTLTLLLERLWEIYRQRVTYARQYAELVEARGGLVVNDHIAFRTLNTKTGAQPAGIAAIERVMLPLGYKAAGEYVFPDTHLYARHYEHSMPLAPKIFISQLEVDRLPSDAAERIRRAVSEARDHLDAAALYDLDAELTDAEVGTVTDRIVPFFTTLPWPLPTASLVREINQVSQYAAWTLLHGNNVNHFTAYINEQNVPEWPDIDATVAALANAGIPLKKQVEGAAGSKLRQTATQAVDVDCPVLDESGTLSTIRWAYAYYELAERGDITDENGRRVRFQGFLGPQAAQLFEMTRR